MEKNDNVIFGKLNPLEKFAGELPVLSKEKQMVIILAMEEYAMNYFFAI